MAIKAYYKFDGNTNASIGVNLDSVAGISYGLGTVGQGVIFGSDNSYARATGGNQSELISSLGTTVLMMVKKNTARNSGTGSNNVRFIYFIQGGGWELLYLSINDGTTATYTNGGNYLSVWAADGTGFPTQIAKYDVNSNLVVDKRYQIGLVWYSDKSFYVIVDGVKVGTGGTSLQSPSAWSNANGEYSIGSLRNSSFRDFDGKIDELKHFNTALSNAEIKNESSYYKGFF